MPLLTPEFNLSQTETEVLVTVYVPAAVLGILLSLRRRWWGRHGGTDDEGRGVEIYLSDDDGPDDPDENDGGGGGDDGNGVQMSVASTLRFFCKSVLFVEIRFFTPQIPNPGKDDPTSGGVPPASYNPHRSPDMHPPEESSACLLRISELFYVCCYADENNLLYELRQYVVVEMGRTICTQR